METYLQLSWLPEIDTVPRVDTLEKGIAWMREEFDRLLAQGAEPPLIVDIIGLPNAGKSKFMRDYGDAHVVAHGHFKDASEGITHTYGIHDPTGEDPTWKKAAKADVVLLQDIAGGLNLVNAIKHGPLTLVGRFPDMAVVLLNPDLGHSLETTLSSIAVEAIRQKLKLIIVNRGSYIKGT